MPRKPDAERKRISRARRRASGIVEILVAVPADKVDRIRHLAQRLLWQHQIKQPFKPEDDTP